LEITNKSIPGPKPVAVIDGGIHAREMVPPEMAMALIDYLTSNYDHDPDVTWLVDYHKIIIVPVVNADGHKKAEIGLIWRKNTDNDDGCDDPSRWGTDLNRNFYLRWGCCGGSSPDPCTATYRGPSPDSEPEVYSYEDYVRSHMPDQWDYIGTLEVHPIDWTLIGAY
jgi:murein tripeptide amidase MpaA